MIHRVTVSPGGFNLHIPRNYTQTAILTVTTGEGTDLTNLRLVADETMHPNGVFPPGLHITLPGSAGILPASSSVTLPVTLWADNTADETGTLTLTMLSDDCVSTNEAGDCTDTQSKVWETVVINTHFSVALPLLSVSPTYVDTGLAHNDTVTETVTFSNTGLAPVEGMTLSLLADTSGTPVPSWVSLLSTPNPGALAVGESYDAAIAFHPDDTVEEGLHQFVLRVTGASHPAIDIGLYATVTQSGQGQVLFKLSDIYTGTLDEGGNPIRGLAGAKIKLQHETVWSIEETLATDSFGEALFVDLPVGRYRYRITAADHDEAAGWCWVKPGITSTQEIFLEYELVTVEWEVKEITIKDTYDIVLNTTYKTDVPAAVVVAEPASVSLPLMQPGDVFQGEITLTNHGLIQAEQVVFALPADDQYFAYALLTEVPEIIAAGASVTIPYRVTSLHTVAGGDDGNASGGGSCGEYTSCSRIVYIYECVNGQWVLKDQYATCFTSVPPACAPADLTVSPTTWTTPNASQETVKTTFQQTFGQSSVSQVSVYDTPLTSLEGTFCDRTPPSPRDPEDPIPPDADEAGGDGPPTLNPDPSTVPEPEDACPSAGAPPSDGTCPTGGDVQQDQCTTLGSSIDHLQRDYQRDDRDLYVKIPGGGITVRRIFRQKQWYLSPGTIPMGRSEGAAEPPPQAATPSSLEFLTRTVADDEVVTAIVKDGNSIYAPPEGSLVKIVTILEDGTEQITYGYTTAPIYLNGTAKIRQVEISDTASGWLWTTKAGYWKLYDAEGRFLSFGNQSRAGQIGQTRYAAIYADSEPGRISGYADRHGQQVLWVEYHATGLLKAMHDGQGQRVEYEYDETGRLSSVTDVQGTVTGFTYDDEGRMIGVSKPGGGASTVNYDVYGRVTSVTDQAGQTTRFHYDYDKRKEEYYTLIEYPSGRVKEVWYDEEGDTKRVDIDGITVKTIEKDGNALVVTDEQGRVTRKEYDEWQNLTRIVYPDETSVSFAYEHTFHRLVKKTGVDGLVTEYAYDEQGRLIQKTVAAGTDLARVAEYAYDDQDNLSRISLQGDELLETHMSYDADGNLTALVDPENQETTFTYNRMGQVLTMTDARGTVWEYSYDTRGNLTSVTNPLQETTLFRYDAAGMLVETEDAQQQVTRYDYDLNQRLSQITTASGVTTFSYNAEGWLESLSDPEQRQTRYGYDGRGRRTSILDGANNEILIEYDDSSGGGSSCSSCSSGRGASQPSRILYPNGAETRFRYDIRGRTIEETTIADGETLTTTFDYDPVGRLVATTGPDGQTVSYSYDLLNRITSLADVSGQTGYEYDLRGNLLALSDAKGQTTRFDYDKNGRLIMERRPLGQETAYAYDAVGNLVEKREPNGNVTTYSYNDAGRLTEINAGNATESLQTSFTYTPTGQLQSYDNGTTSATYEYDALGRKTRATVNYGAFTKSFSYSYYANGLKKSFTMPDGTSYDYAYGDNNELRTIQIPGLGSISVPSYTWNSPDALLFPGGSTQEFSYDPLQRLQRIQAKDPGGNSVLDYSYEYDTIGNIQKKITEHGTYNYGYDAVQRLTGVDVDVPGLEDEAFSYDAVGNRQSVSNVTGDILHNANNELERYGDVEYAYDSNGNLTQVTLNNILLFEYTYNANNRLVKVEGGNSNTIAEYSYNPFGRRLWKEVGGTRTYFFYSDEGLVAEYDAHGIELKTYGYRPDSTWTTDPLWLKRGSEYYFYQNDHLGTPQKLTAVNGAVVWSAQYTAFGKADVQIETITNDLRFPGQYYDAETGLHYNWFRYYDPTIGRYVRPDPIGFGSGINLYTYVAGNPIHLIDPLGLKFSDWYLPHYTSNGEVQSAILLRLLVPGQVSWDNAQNAARRGDYAGAAVHVGSMVLQDVLLALMWGQASALVQAGASGLITSTDVVADVCEVPMPEDITHGHHTYPKAVGGHPNQVLADIVESLHTGREGIHSDLAKFEGGWLRPKRGMTGKQIVEKFGQDAVEEGLRRFYSQNKYKHLLDTFEKAVEFTHKISDQ